MPDGTGDEVVSPTFDELNQLGWDMQYIRTKLTFDGSANTFVCCSAKTFVWQKSGAGYAMTLGLIESTSGNLIDGFRSMAGAIAAGFDGVPPPIENFGKTSWSFDQLKVMYANLVTVGGKIMTGKRTMTMRMTSLAGTNVIMTIGDVASSSTSNRLAIRTLADFVSQGLG